MARVRWAKSQAELERAAASNPEFLPSTVRSVRCVYETDPAAAAAVVPRPLQLAAPEVCVTFSQVSIHLTPETTFEIGSAIFGVRATHDGVDGIYLVTMPMTTEQAVVPGRETYGEPKKIAAIDFTVDGDRVASKVARMGIPYLEVTGTLGASQGPREMIETGFCFKAQPSCERGKGFDQDPLLVQLTWRHRHDEVRKIENGVLTLRESPFDPVADLPLRRLVKIEYESGRAESNGRVIGPIPGEWLLPYLHQRYDDPGAVGVEV
jgi:acetoacetate decarboxylase